MAVEKIFINTKNAEIRCYQNQYNNTVISIRLEKDNICNFVFDNVSELKQFIKELKKLT